MAKIISLHSFRRGTGKTNIAVSSAFLMANRGWRVGLIDVNLKFPSAHIPLGIDIKERSVYLNDYLSGSQQQIDRAIIDVTEELDAGLRGKLFLIPPSPRSFILPELEKPFDLDRLRTGYDRLTKQLKLDYILIDTQAGINEKSLVSLASSDMVVVLLRLDKQDYAGTAILINLARQLEVEEIGIVINDVTTSYDIVNVTAQMERTYGIEVISVIPHSQDMMALGSRDIFPRVLPEHPLTQVFEALIDRLVR